MASASKSAAKTPAQPKPKAQGRSLHIGLNFVDPRHYEGWDGELLSCEFDAKDMAALARQRGITPTVLLRKQATRAKVLAALRAAAKASRAGDYFLLSFSGHGGQVKDGNRDEPDGRDETWCLFDGQLIDDELYLELSTFAAGVRILVLSDSCHSGSVVRAGPPSDLDPAPRGRPREMPRRIGERVYDAHRKFYDTLQRDVEKRAGGRVVDPDAALANVSVSSRATAIVKNFKPSVILISGCQDNQSSYDGEHNGAFTEALFAIWRDAAFAGNHTQFHTRIRARMPARQSPNLFTLGPAAKFLAQPPFRV